MLLRTAYKMKPPVSARLNTGHPLADKLIACYLLNEGSGVIAFDSSGLGNQGTFTGGVTWAVAKYGWALDFDGSSGYVSVADSASLDLTTQATIGFWTKTTQAPAIGGFWFSKYVEGVSGYESHLRGDGTVRFIIHHGTPTSTLLDTVAAVNDGNWHNIVCRFNNGAMRVFIDGVQDTRTATAPVTSIPTNNTALLLGVRGGFFLEGLIDHVMIYSRALADSEISRAYTNPFSMFGRRVGAELVIDRDKS